MDNDYANYFRQYWLDAGYDWNPVRGGFERNAAGFWISTKDLSWNENDVPVASGFPGYVKKWRPRWQGILERGAPGWQF
jgi:hypothetical protein